MKALVVGGAALDTVIAYEEMENVTHRRASFEQTYLLLREGDKIEATAQRYSSGGGATNASVSFKRQGIEPILFCKIARDLPGDFILKELESYQIDTSQVCFSESEGTATSFVVPSLSGDRTLFAYRGANATVLSKELPLNALSGVDFVYVTSLAKDSAEHLPELAQAAHERNISVAVNPGISQLKLGSAFLKKALFSIDILITNDYEAKQLMSSLEESESADRLRHLNDAFSLQRYVEKILALGPKIVVITCGRKGVYVATLEDGIFYHPIVDVPVVNTLGAGDAFGSTFVGSYYRGMGLHQSVQAGIINSASVVGFVGAKEGLLEQDVLQKKIAELDPKAFQRL